MWSSYWASHTLNGLTQWENGNIFEIRATLLSMKQTSLTKHSCSRLTAKSSPSTQHRLHFEMSDLDVPIYKPLTWIPANSGPTKSPCAAPNDFPRVSGIKSEWRPGGQVLGEPRQGGSLLKVSTVGAGDVSCLQCARNKQIWNWSSCSEHWTKITSKQRRLQHRCQPWLPLPIQ